MVGQDFDEAVKPKYKKLRNYFNRNNFMKERQLVSSNEFKRISNILLISKKKQGGKFLYIFLNT